MPAHLLVIVLQLSLSISIRQFNHRVDITGKTPRHVPRELALQIPNNIRRHVQLVPLVTNHPDIRLTHFHPVRNRQHHLRHRVIRPLGIIIKLELQQVIPQPQIHAHVPLVRILPLQFRIPERLQISPHPG